MIHPSCLAMLTELGSAQLARLRCCQVMVAHVCELCRPAPTLMLEVTMVPWPGMKSATKMGGSLTPVGNLVVLTLDAEALAVT